MINIIFGEYEAQNADNARMSECDLTTNSVKSMQQTTSPVSGDDNSVFN